MHDFYSIFKNMSHTWLKIHCSAPQWTICRQPIIYLNFSPFQELIFSLEGFQPFGWYLTLVQFACYGIFGIVESNWQKDFNRR